MSRRPAILAGLLAPALALAAALVATPVQAGPVRAAAVDYVALGDSYSSGVGTPGATGSCARSPQGYPRLWVARHEVSSFRDATCGGATTDDVLAGQVGALDAGTDLVSITIGGNDAGFASTVLSCVFGTDSGCANAVATARAYMTRTLPAELDATYAAIRSRAPGARLVVLGYPRLFELTATCGLGGMSLAKRRVLNAGADDLHAVVEARAVAARATYVDVRDDFAGHGVCGRTPWINNVSILRPADSFHPNAAGYASGYLPAFTAVTG